MKFFRDMPEQGLPVTQAKDIRDKRLRLKTDVVIVGSGAGGSVMAYELAKAGKKVTVLEAGPYVPSSEFNEKLGDSMNRLYQDEGTQPNTLGDLVVLQGACIGGSSVVSGCISFRTPDYVLKKWQEEFGLTNLTKETLTPYFDKVEKNLNVHENEPHEINNCAKKIIAGCESFGASWKPVARHVKQCALTGHCLAGCPSDRKMSMLVSYLPWATAFGARIYADTKVYKVLEENCRTVGVLAEIIDPVSQEKISDLRVDADVVVLAAGAVQTPIILQRSSLCDENRWLGKNLSAHPFVTMLAKFKDDVHGWRGAFSGMYIDQWQRPDRGGYLFESGLAGPEHLVIQGEQGSGEEHVQFMLDYKHYSGMNIFLHDDGQGSVVWDGDALHGYKKIKWELSGDDFDRLKEAVKIAGRIYFAAGAEKVYLPTYRKLVVKSVDELDDMVDSVQFGLRGLYTFRTFTVNPQGTTRMGADPLESVVDPYGETHAVKGLFVADASILPSGVTVNPQTTIYALSNYIADRLMSRHDDYFS